jgi:O-antigen ligase
MHLPNKITQFLHKHIFFLTTFWISGYFFFPRGKIHDQVFILIFALPALWLLIKKEITFKPFLKSKLFFLALAYCAYWIISTSWGTYKNINIHLSVIKSALYIYLFWVIFFATYYLDDKKMASLFKCVTICAAASVLVNLILFYGLDHHTLVDRFNGFGRLRNQLWVAAIYGAMAIMMLSFAVQPNTKNKLMYVLLFAVFFIATLLTHSRTPIAAMFAVSIFLFYTSQLPIKPKLLCTFVMLILLALAYFLFGQYYLSDVSRGQSYRLDLWSGFLEATKNRLAFGIGANTEVLIRMPGNFVDGWSHYHNAYLGSLIELGLVGLILHVMLVIYTIVVGWQNRHHLYVNTALMIFIFTCILSITYGQGIVTNKNVQWIIFWLPLSVIIMHELNAAGIKKYIPEQQYGLAPKN